MFLNGLTFAKSQESRLNTRPIGDKDVLMQYTNTCDRYSCIHMYLPYSNQISTENAAIALK